MVGFPNYGRPPVYPNIECLTIGPPQEQRRSNLGHEHHLLTILECPNLLRLHLWGVSIDGLPRDPPQSRLEYIEFSHQVNKETVSYVLRSASCSLRVLAIATDYWPSDLNMRRIFPSERLRKLDLLYIPISLVADIIVQFTFSATIEHISIQTCLDLDEDDLMQDTPTKDFLAPLIIAFRQGKRGYASLFTVEIFIECYEGEDRDYSAPLTNPSRYLGTARLFEGLIEAVSDYATGSDAVIRRKRDGASHPERGRRTIPVRRPEPDTSRTTGEQNLNRGGGDTQEATRDTRRPGEASMASRTYQARRHDQGLDYDIRFREFTIVHSPMCHPNFLDE